MRDSLQTTAITSKKDWKKELQRSSNLAFFAAAKKHLPRGYSFLGAIGLVGGNSWPACALQAAQSVLRWDRRPSYWSHCFLICREATKIEETRLWECTLEPYALSDLLPEHNAVTSRTLDAYADPGSYPNVALVAFKLGDKEVKALIARAKKPNIDRLRFPLWDLAGRWIAYLWGGAAVNPLTEGFRMPSAGYVEMAYEAAGIDLTPGSSERNSSPEHIWQTAKWWYKPFEDFGKPLYLQYCLREPHPRPADARKPWLEA